MTSRATSPSAAYPTSATSAHSRNTAHTRVESRLPWSRISSDADAAVGGAHVLAEHRAEEGGRHGDLQRVEDRGQRGDEPHLAQLREPAAAVDPDDVEAGLVGGLEAEQRPDDGREEDRRARRGRSPSPTGRRAASAPPSTTIAMPPTATTRQAVADDAICMTIGSIRGASSTVAASSSASTLPQSEAPRAPR